MIIWFLKTVWIVCIFSFWVSHQWRDVRVYFWCSQSFNFLWRENHPNISENLSVFVVPGLSRNPAGIYPPKKHRYQKITLSISTVHFSKSSKSGENEVKMTGNTLKTENVISDIIELVKSVAQHEGCESFVRIFYILSCWPTSPRDKNFRWFQWLSDF